MIKKYELTDETTRVWTGETLHRIRALRDFGNVKVGQLGGWVESENNLSHVGMSWVADEAMVYDNATIFDSAIIKDGAIAYGSSMIYDEAIVCDHAQVEGVAEVNGTAKIFEHASVSGATFIRDNAEIGGNAMICGCGVIEKDASIFKSTDYFFVSPIGVMSGCLSFYRNVRNEISIRCGHFYEGRLYDRCYYENIDEFRLMQKIKMVHSDNEHAKAYLLAADLAEIRMNTRMEELEFMF